MGGLGGGRRGPPGLWVQVGKGGEGGGLGSRPPWRGGCSPLVIAGDEDTDWPWQGASAGREASLVPGQTSWHISQCVKDSQP